MTPPIYKLNERAVALLVEVLAHRPYNMTPGELLRRFAEAMDQREAEL